MPIVVAPIPEAFAGAGLSASIAPAAPAPDVASIDAAMERHAVLVFRDQPLTDEQQLAFTPPIRRA